VRVGAWATPERSLVWIRQRGIEALRVSRWQASSAAPSGEPLRDLEQTVDADRWGQLSSRFLPVEAALVAHRVEMPNRHADFAAAGPGVIEVAASTMGWAEEERLLLGDAYHGALASPPPLDELLAHLDRASLHLAVRWHGWSGRSFDCPSLPERAPSKPVPVQHLGPDPRFQEVVLPRSRPTERSSPHLRLVCRSGPGVAVMEDVALEQIRDD
jgi:hypothetical protein